MKRPKAMDLPEALQIVEDAIDKDEISDRDADLLTKALVERWGRRCGKAIAAAMAQMMGNAGMAAEVLSDSPKQDEV
jgi:hypothetical protein